MQVRQMRANLHGIQGLTYVPEYVSKAEEDDLFLLVDRSNWSTELKRRVQHYGYRYDYKRRQADSRSYLGRLPGWLLALAERLHYDGLIARVPDQSAINEYLPGQGIATHVDCIPCFGDTVISLSLGSPCVMEFSRDGVKIPVLLEPRSVLVMSDVARYQWKHGIPARKHDHYEGEDYTRGRRLSITFRSILLEAVEAQPAYAAPRRAIG
jgi:alkylated DNA repair dioxygenase AlkB